MTRRTHLVGHSNFFPLNAKIQTRLAYDTVFCLLVAKSFEDSWHVGEKRRGRCLCFRPALQAF